MYYILTSIFLKTGKVICQLCEIISLCSFVVIFLIEIKENDQPDLTRFTSLTGRPILKSEGVVVNVHQSWGFYFLEMINGSDNEAEVK